MNRRDLALAVMGSQKEGLSQAACGRVVDLVVDRITGALAAGDQVRLNGFGTFQVKGRKGRTGVNPQTGAAVEIPPSKAVKFKPATALKEELNK